MHLNPNRIKSTKKGWQSKKKGDLSDFSEESYQSATNVNNYNSDYSPSKTPRSEKEESENSNSNQSEASKRNPERFRIEDKVVVGKAELKINSYIKKHPLTQLLEESSWNNIPVPLQTMLAKIVDTIIGLDIN